MTKREAGKQLVELYAAATRLGFYDENGTAAEVVALAVGALLKDGEDDG